MGQEGSWSSTMAQIQGRMGKTINAEWFLPGGMNESCWTLKIKLYHVYDV
jgi:hypothetical protein